MLRIYNLVAVIFFAMIAIKPNQSTTVKSWLRLPDLGTQCGLALGLLTGLFMLSTAHTQCLGDLSSAHPLTFKEKI